MLIRTGMKSLQSARKVCATVLQVIFAPWRITYDPIAELLQANDAAADAAADAQATINSSSLSKADILTSSWIDRKLSELSWVGITVRGFNSRLMVPLD